MKRVKRVRRPAPRYRPPARGICSTAATALRHDYPVLRTLEPLGERPLSLPISNIHSILATAQRRVNTRLCPMPRWSPRGKSVGQYVMTGQSVVDLVEALQTQGAHPCVGGGWGVDALLGHQTRDHSDLDLWLPAKEFAQLIVIFAAHGIDRILP